MAGGVLRSMHDSPAEDWDAKAVDKECMVHVAAAKLATRQAKFIGIVVDKADVRGNTLQNAAASTPAGVAFELVPQVVVIRIRFRQGKVIC